MRRMISEHRTETTEYRQQNPDYRTQRTDKTTESIKLHITGSRFWNYAKVFAFCSFLIALSCSSAFAGETATLDTGNTAWILVATALVLFMTLPGLALFYGGLVRTKNVLSVLLQCFAISGIVTILWLVAGYSIAFSEGISTISAQLSIQFIGVAATAGYTAIATFVILKAVNAITALRVCRECEVEGLDVYGHGEQGYIL